MPTKRREIRESAFILIFEKLFRDDTIDEIIELADNIDGIIINSDVIKTFSGTVEKSAELDNIITRYSEKRTVDRIPKVNLAILRLALFEGIYDEKVPLNVAISEAVLLGKKFAQEADVSFINGVLGAYSRSGDAPND
ncbi:MAG: transcription antitermination factor NusB [Oscillospiraceae bacterium]|jgi:N utilization substance protein B